jgi:hypothetical protein
MIFLGSAAMFVVAVATVFYLISTRRQSHAESEQTIVNHHKESLASVSCSSIMGLLEDLSDGRMLSERQAAALESLGFSGSDRLMMKQATAILSARDYAEGCAMILFGAADGYAFEAELEQGATLFILQDRKRRDRAMRWNDQLFRSGNDIPSPPPDDATRKAVIKFMSMQLATRLIE